jgi:hypothetical protein
VGRRYDRCMTDQRHQVNLRFEAKDTAWIEHIAETITESLPDGDGLTLGARPERAEPPYVMTGMAEVTAPTRADAADIVREPLRGVEDVWVTVQAGPDESEPDLILTDQDFNL